MATTAPLEGPAASSPEKRESSGERTQDLDALFPGRYLSITSFKRDGTAVATPVWFVSDGRRLFAFTDLHSAKIRRVRRDPHVLVASCRPWGALRGKPLDARAEVLTAPADLERVRELLPKRYRISYRVVMFMYRLGRSVRGKRAVADGAALEVTVDWPPGINLAGGMRREELRP